MPFTGILESTGGGRNGTSLIGIFGSIDFIISLTRSPPLFVSTMILLASYSLKAIQICFAHSAGSYFPLRSSKTYILSSNPIPATMIPVSSDFSETVTEGSTPMTILSMQSLSISRYFIVSGFQTRFELSRIIWPKISCAPNVVCSYFALIVSKNFAERFDSFSNVEPLVK